MIALTALALTAAPTVLGANSTEKAMHALQAYGQCVVDDRPDAAASVLAQDFRTESYRLALRALMKRAGPCRGRELPKGVVATSGLPAAGALAEALLRRNRILDDLEARTAVHSDLPPIEARNAGELVAICAIRGDSDSVARLLRTDAGSDAELDALRAVGSSVSKCLPAKTKSSFTRESLRALVSLAAYRLATFNAQVPK